MMMMMMLLIAHLAAEDGAPAVHTWLRCSRRDINIAPARRTRRRSDKNTSSASGTECLQHGSAT